jgi:CRP-like cAMP-binding protein
MHAATSSAIKATRLPVPAALLAGRPQMPVPSHTARAGQAIAPDRLERLGTVVRHERNRTIYFEGDDVQHCFKVRSGTVRLCKMTEDGRRQIAAFLSAGDLFGWVDRDTYSFSAEAVTDVTVEKYSRRSIDDAATADPTMMHRMLAVVSEQLTSAHNHLLLLGRMTAPERIASFLIDLAKRKSASRADAGTIELHMNRKDLADYLGLTVETVSRVMSALKRKGLISFSTPECVRVTQSTALERLAMAA